MPASKSKKADDPQAKLTAALTQVRTSTSAILKDYSELKTAKEQSEKHLEDLKEQNHDLREYGRRLRAERNVEKQHSTDLETTLIMLEAESRDAKKEMTESRTAAEDLRQAAQELVDLPHFNAFTGVGGGEPGVKLDRVRAVLEGMQPASSQNLTLKRKRAEDDEDTAGGRSQMASEVDAQLSLLPVSPVRETTNI